MPSGNRLEGKTAIVTGGASGIGEATSRLFVQEGAKVVIADIDYDKGNALEAELNASGEVAVYRKFDVTQESRWIEVVDEMMSKWGRLDIVVNNAGMSGAKGRATVEDTIVENWDTVFAVNSTAIMLGTKTAIPAMRKNGGGSVVNVSSIFGIVGSPAGAAYHASKGAARTFSKAAAVQYAPDNIRVNSVHPGFTDTPMTLDIHSQQEIRDARLAMTPMGRLGLPIDIAFGILYLASDEAGWVTGTELVIDGGEIAW
ncbi:SDR family NAD(P)-dependent oxidoreductase [Candidatus Lucifugimonas marina]|uniref:Glucose 1-dehydrogenase n=1 Tax=Candidatus Lucifugimonas marina TaxID=3038979 RepID=A0AAJ5ZHZ7_9CHLR|nr:glucose 1-dehydrogenase [SAR202 cluster bacterium JH702]MDG0868456.1 glucose 1-dehydrogenase [SAR202 cluster bacterium JH639]WFG35089.1 glucose 1-dehydrogenase [SAR202 cluster bacterium JH545]WFG39046.1 glucose 1-dehydrogenase [SAR202 cluster bacterium JH1073]